MIPLIDTHCHLLAGMDDGPKTREDAVSMCRILHEEGVQLVAALAHQNEEYPNNTPQRIHQATKILQEDIHQAEIPLTAVVCSEVMVHPETRSFWANQELLTVGDHRVYILIEMPHGLFVDLLPLAEFFRQEGIRPIIAHAERCPELLEQPDLVEDLIRAGCLVQVSSGSVTGFTRKDRVRALRDWFVRGIAHVMGSDGHSPRRRKPRMADAYHQIVTWAGNTVADRVCSTNGMAVLQGLPLNLSEPKPRRKGWLLPSWLGG